MSWFTKLVISLFVAYIAKSVHVFYEIFHYKQCDKQINFRSCIDPFIYSDHKTGEWPPVQLRIYVNSRKMPEWKQLQHIYTKKNLDLSNEMEETIKLNIPPTVRRNGTMQAYVFLMNNDFDGEDFDDTEWLVKDTVPLTVYEIPKANTFNLMSNKTTHQSKTLRPVTHLRSVLPVNVMTESLVLDMHNLPDEIRHYIYLVNGVSAKKSYLPFMDLDDMRIRTKDLVEIERNAEAMNLSISYLPISWGRFRLSASMKLTFQQFIKLGFSNKDMDEMKGIFSDTNFYFLALTVVVATVHIIFDYLTFKNDVKFWRGRKTMVGISMRTLLWRSFSDTIIFLYLWDEESSYLILVPSGICALIEYWKLQKALKVKVNFQGWKPIVTFGEQTEEEKQTGEFDTQGMKYLSYLLIPLCIAGAIYNLIYVPQRSWSSWLIKCLANCIYCFGFLFMLPQLFLNYKLKSVAHLPWRAFMYKAFNTFIDDVFAFIITMPTAHRLACFRDDIVFLIYLYQRYLYPVDKTRVNEFGEAFTDQPKATDETKKTQ